MQAGKLESPPPLRHIPNPPIPGPKAPQGSNQATAVSRPLQTSSQVMAGPQLAQLTN